MFYGYCHIKIRKLNLPNPHVLCNNQTLQKQNNKQRNGLHPDPSPIREHN